LIVLDANLLLYSYDTHAVDHRAAEAFVSRIFSGPEMVGLPWQTIMAFIRVSTNTRISGTALAVERAIAIVGEWIELPQVALLAPTAKHWTILQQMLIGGRVSGPACTDAALAALTIEHAGVLYTTDRGFARYPGLRFLNPLTQP
jgi:uncharacterized protein